MPQDPTPSRRYQLSSLTNPPALARLASIGIILLIIAGLFVYASGWLSPARLSQARFVDRFELVNGIHAGFRRNHAKGVCVSGNFESNGQGSRRSKAAVFQPGRVPIVGRFSLAGGHPHIADDFKAVLAMALSFRPANGEEWRTGMIDIPVFTVKDPEGLYEEMLASLPDPATGKPDPVKMAAFGAAHPEFGPAVQLIMSSPRASGFANATFNGIVAFRFINADGVATNVRWSMVAVEPFIAATPDQAKSGDKNYLFDDLMARLARGPLQWHLIVTIGQPSDPTNDPTKLWPSDREHMDVGILTIDHAETEAPGNCRDINFDPLVLPAGIEPSDDLVLAARSAAYSESFRRREGETKTPSAVRVPSSGKGS